MRNECQGCPGGSLLKSKHPEFPLCFCLLSCFVKILFFSNLYTSMGLELTASRSSFSHSASWANQAPTEFPLWWLHWRQSRGHKRGIAKNYALCKGQMINKSGAEKRSTRKCVSFSGHWVAINFSSIRICIYKLDLTLDFGVNSCHLCSPINLKIRI